MAKRIKCECGHVVEGNSDEELVANAREHIVSKHPDMVGVSDETILAMVEEA